MHTRECSHVTICLLKKMDSDTSKKLAEVLANKVPARIPSGDLKDNAAFVTSPKDHVAETPSPPVPPVVPQSLQRMPVARCLRTTSQRCWAGWKPAGVKICHSSKDISPALGSTRSPSGSAFHVCADAAQH